MHGVRSGVSSSMSQPQGSDVRPGILMETGSVPPVLWLLLQRTELKPRPALSQGHGQGEPEAGLGAGPVSLGSVPDASRALLVTTPARPRRRHQAGGWAPSSRDDY